MKLITAAVTLALVATPAIAADWRFTSASAQGTMQFVDIESVTEVGTSKQFWLQVLQTEPFSNGATRAITRYELDCSQRRLRLLAVTFYKEREPVASHRTTGSWDYVYPESIMESTANRVCANDHRPPLEVSPEEFAKAYFEMFHAE